ncbi:hypothetical protein SAMN03080617_00020 [Algoriphagus alkaliphilus]|uniref:Uncharacterized protein n=1 Tax=Algoriphagus alkaliphilus TaxID=279824 RepID=A0A1G5UU88_9BACT|nr:hypothetical protein [Algoriphagus alkaliphilus]MBA4300081.1 hypothetical protein [Cyclobacterium sp.]SDA37192.1 hypothetical protein SAMN03080617_00020 [Algoriphagus alkaliphilus]
MGEFELSVSLKLYAELVKKVVPAASAEMFIKLRLFILKGDSGWGLKVIKFPFENEFLPSQTLLKSFFLNPNFKPEINLQGSTQLSSLPWQIMLVENQVRISS